MNDTVKEFIVAANKQIIERARGILILIFDSDNNETIVKNITDEIEYIKELLTIRTKLLK